MSDESDARCAAMGPHRTILDHAESHASRHPDKAALVAGQGEITTYAGLWSKAIRLAGALEQHGVGVGDRVVLTAGASNDHFPAGYLAAHLLGAVAVPIDPKTPAARAAWIADKTAAKLVLGESAIEGDRRAWSYEDLLASGGQPMHRASPDRSGLADVLFTTGTTGEPKGVMLTHGAIVTAAENINAFVGNEPEDVEVVPLPLSHSFGLGRLRCNLVRGGTLVLVSGFSFPGLVFKAIETNRATGLAAVPTGFDILLRTGGDRLGRYADQLRYVEIGSAPMPAESRRRLMRLLPTTRICMHYGLTEASRAAFTEFHADADHLDSIGKPTPNVRLAIWDEAGHELPAGSVGRIMVQGGMVTTGYWHNEDATRRALAGGWLYTGDYGRRDSAGYFYLEAREQELINVGGRKVSPIEVERQIEQHAQIEACACVGVPDPNGMTGETVWAYLVARDAVDETRLVEALRGVLEPYKIPSNFLYVNHIPTTESGKVQRLELRRRALEEHFAPGENRAGPPKKEGG